MKPTAWDITHRAFGRALGGVACSLAGTASASDKLAWDKLTGAAETLER
ncbi:MAG TPA: hypothetical protein VGH38_32740 [Bryobacteraceae bacterium]|jgi:hypothetical protein